MTAFIKTPFADSGDKTTVPDTDSAGNVNWAQGFPGDYSKDPDTDASAKRIEREDFNGLVNQITKAINEIQINGVAPFITAADNGGSAFSYGAGAIVFYNKGLWTSLVDGNTITPVEGSNWTQIYGKNIFGTGVNQVPTMADFKGTFTGSNWWVQLPNGFICQGGTITLTAIGAFNPLTINGVTIYTHYFRITFPKPYPNAQITTLASLASPPYSTQGAMGFKGVTVHRDEDSPGAGVAKTRFSVAVSNPFTGEVPVIHWSSFGY